MVLTIFATFVKTSKIIVLKLWMQFQLRGKISIGPATPVPDLLENKRYQGETAYNPFSAPQKLRTIEERGNGAL